MGPIQTPQNRGETPGCGTTLQRAQTQAESGCDDGSFSGDELVSQIHTTDRSRAEIGPANEWPLNLRIALSVCLTSRFPMQLWWGPALTMFYNDAYVAFLGRPRHQATLGRSAPEAWYEVWPTIGPIVDQVRSSGLSGWVENVPMFLDRSVSKEEVYVTFSFSPVYDDDEHVDGVLCVCTETTDALVEARRVETLTNLGTRANLPQQVDDACATAADALASNPQDVPFAAIYLVDETQCTATLTAATGLAAQHALPEWVSLNERDGPGWPFAAVLRDRRPQVVSARDAAGERWPETAQEAMLLPMIGVPSGLILLGLSPRRPLDTRYRSFLELVAGRIGQAVSEARIHENARLRSEARIEFNRAKAAFLASIGPEFRTPLALMLAPLEDALTLLPESARSLLEPQLQIAHRSALRLLKVVNTVFELSRARGGRLEASFEPTELASLTSELASVLRTPIERAGLSLRVHCKPLPEPVYVDREMWERIVLNLLANALRSTVSGEIDVSLRLVGEHVELSVRDTGGGVSSDDLPGLFKRLEDGRTSGASGIGLALVHDLVRAHAGEIRAFSTVERGTTFVVALLLGTAHLPADQIRAGGASEHATASAQSVLSAETLRWLAADEQTLTASTQRSRQAPGDERILVATLDLDMRECLKRVLSPRWRVDALPDAETALAAALSSKFDLIVTDGTLPKIAGSSLLQALRAEPKLQALPVILLGTRSDDPIQLAQLHGCADDYLLKPFSACELVTRIDAHLKLSARRAADLSHYHKREKILSAARDAAMRANESKSRFLAAASHDLRQPLQTILLLQSVLSRALAATELAPDVQLFGEAARSMDELLSALLDINRLETGAIRPDTRAFPLNEILPRLRSDLSYSASNKSLQLEIPDTSELVCSDPALLQVILRNLIGNAIKYTRQGRICVRVCPKGGEVCIEVEDSGMGMAGKHLEHIFEAFYQIDNPNRDKQRGMGLGLSIVQQVSQLLDHKVTVETREGQGSTFTVRVPRVLASEAPPPRRKTTSASERPPRPLTLLHIEDDPAIARLMSTVLRFEGYQVISACSREEALQRVDTEHVRPDLIVSDYQLPADATGDEVVAEIALRLGARPPTILLTGDISDEHRLRAERVVDRVLFKPVEIELLLRELAELNSKATRA